jgi:uncharacterized integral membrane protein
MDLSLADAPSLLGLCISLVKKAVSTVDTYQKKNLMQINYRREPHAGLTARLAATSTQSLRQCAPHDQRKGFTMKGNVAAIVLIVLGAFFLMTNLGLVSISLAELLKTWWPLILIALGVAMIVKRTDNK